MNLDRWLNSARILRAPDDGTGAAASTTAPATTAADAGSTASAATSAPPAAEAVAPVPSAASAAPESTAPAAEAPAETKSTPSLLGAAEAKGPSKDASSDQGSDAAKAAETAAPATDAAKPDAAKPDAAKDAAKDGATGKDAPAPASEALAAKPQARTYDAFKVPEGLKLDDKQVGDFTGVLENAELSHQERAQKLIDMHVGEIDRVVKEQRTNQLNAWSDFTDKLKTDFKNDPELGGNRQETTLSQAKYVVEQLGGTKDQVADLIGMLDHTGMGNHVGLTRLLNTVYERFLAEGRPVPGSAPTRAARGNFQDVMYGGPGNGSGS